MEFGLSAEQHLIVATVRSFVENEIYPHERLVETRRARTAVTRPAFSPRLALKGLGFAHKTGAEAGGESDILGRGCAGVRDLRALVWPC